MPLLERVRPAIAKHDVSQIVFSALSKIDDRRFSKFLTGQVTLPDEASERVRRVVDFIETIADAGKPFPVCFHSAEKIRPIWDAFQQEADRPAKMKTTVA